MSQATPSEWHKVVLAVEESIGQCLQALDRYEESFAKVLSEAPAALPELPDPAASARESEWDAKLTLASRRAEDVEQLLSEQEAVWGRWQQTFQGWKQLLASRSTTP